MDLAQMFGGAQSGTFLGLPAVDPTADPEADIVILGADTATPYASVGAYCAGGAAAIRAGSAAYGGVTPRYNFDLGQLVRPEGVRMVDAGDLAIALADAPGNRARIAEAVGRVAGAGAVPVVLGGDDSVPIPMLQALGDTSDLPLTILQIDAHIDWRDSVDGERWGLSSTMRRASEMGHVAEIIQVGARGVGSAGPETVAAAGAWGATIIPAHETGPQTAAQVADLVPEGRRVVICLDLDALDPSIMPAVIAPTPGGLGYREVVAMVQAVAGRAPVAGLAMVEFMPEADRDGVGARVAAQLLITLIGIIARQRVGG